MGGQKALLFQLDGKIPNLALMRIAAHHRDLGDDVELRIVGNEGALERKFWDERDRCDQVYASAIFTRSQRLAKRLKEIWPKAIIGGSGVDAPPLIVTHLSQAGIETRDADYSIYPRYQHSIGFTQRGCRMNKKTCGWCSVPDREDKARAEDSINAIWRGDPWPKHLLLLDNDTFGNPNWRAEIAAIRDGGFKVCWTQGINARLLTDEACEAIASVEYRDDSFTKRQFYTAWDNTGTERPLFKGLESLVKYGMNPDHIIVYLLIGYDGSQGGTAQTTEDWLYRHKLLREFGCRPYPMPWVRNRETVGFQRWVVPAYDKRFSWDEWRANGYRPEGLKESQEVGELLCQ